jgi:histidyl-tRNA synthetase
VGEAPTIAPFLTPEAQAHWDALRRHLDAFGLPWRENPRIVRGLDYYSHTAFEFVTDRLGAQGTVMAGGRYDGLIGHMGGPETPAVGWAAGIERLAMLVAEPALPRVAVAVLVENGGDRLAATGGALAAPIGRATMAAALQGAP